MICHWRRTFAHANPVQFEMLEFGETREFERPPGTIQRAAVHNKNALRIFCRCKQAFDAAANAGEAGHLRRAIARELTRDAVGDFTGVGAARTGIDYGRWFA